MPIYEYRCPSCDEVVEIMHSMSDESVRTCETCSSKLERLISRTSFALKGGGWYKDLYSSPKPDSGGSAGASESKSDSGESSGGGSKDSGSSGGKGESKSAGGSSSKSD